MFGGEWRTDFIWILACTAQALGLAFSLKHSCVLQGPRLRPRGSALASVS